VVRDRRPPAGFESSGCHPHPGLRSGTEDRRRSRGPATGAYASPEGSTAPPPKRSGFRPDLRRWQTPSRPRIWRGVHRPDRRAASAARRHGRAPRRPKVRHRKRRPAHGFGRREAREQGAEAGYRPGPPTTGPQPRALRCPGYEPGAEASPEGSQASDRRKRTCSAEGGRRTGEEAQLARGRHPGVLRPALRCQAGLPESLRPSPDGPPEVRRRHHGLRPAVRSRTLAEPWSGAAISSPRHPWGSVGSPQAPGRLRSARDRCHDPTEVNDWRSDSAVTGRCSGTGVHGGSVAVVSPDGSGGPKASGCELRLVSGHRTDRQAAVQPALQDSRPAERCLRAAPASG
jgi:hypothetical protein